MLCNRPKPISLSIIPEAPKGFILESTIMEHIIMTYDVMHWSKAHSLKATALSLDFAKAYEDSNGQLYKKCCREGSLGTIPGNLWQVYAAQKSNLFPPMVS